MLQCNPVPPVPPVPRDGVVLNFGESKKMMSLGDVVVLIFSEFIKGTRLY